MLRSRSGAARQEDVAEIAAPGDVCGRRSTPGLNEKSFAETFNEMDKELFAVTKGRRISVSSGLRGEEKEKLI